MNSAMDQSGFGEDAVILEQIVDCLNTGVACSLVTLVQTYGSAPRLPGAMMLITHAGQYFGSLSGGCIEERLIDEFVEHPATHVLQCTFGPNQTDPLYCITLPCGADLNVVIEPVLFSQLGLYQQLLQGIKKGQTIQRILDLSTGSFSVETCSYPGSALSCKENKIYRLFGAPWQLYIIGATPLAACLCELANQLQFKVTLFDPRIEYCEQLKPVHCNIICGAPEEELKLRPIDCRTAVVSVAHDPKIDEFSLITALKSDAFFVGALGSSRTTKSRKNRLLNEWQVDGALVEKLNAPIGLDISSRTPMEIAVSIAAQLIQVRQSNCQT